MSLFLFILLFSFTDFFVLVKTPNGDIGAGRLLAIVQTRKALSYCILLFSLPFLSLTCFPFVYSQGRQVPPTYAAQ